MIESARKYIQDDDSFSLHRITSFDIYLKCGITTFVTEFGEAFHDMTLIQFAIAMRKPKVLKGMLETSYYKCQVPFDKIIIPETSNTKGNLLDLAVEFGSNNIQYGENYKNTDIKCLEVVIDFAKSIDKDFNIDIENLNGETALFKAIDYQNNEACTLLLKNGADIFHASEQNIFIKSPLWHLLEVGSYVNTFSSIITSEILGDKFINVRDELNSDQIKEFLREIKNPIASEFVNIFLKNNSIIKPIFKKTDSDIQLIQMKCTSCKEQFESKNQRHLCDKCSKYFCQNCFNDHICKSES